MKNKKDIEKQIKTIRSHFGSSHFGSSAATVLLERRSRRWVGFLGRPLCSHPLLSTRPSIGPRPLRFHWLGSSALFGETGDTLLIHLGPDFRHIELLLTL